MQTFSAKHISAVINDGPNRSLAKQVIGQTGHWANRALVEQVIGNIKSGCTGIIKPQRTQRTQRKRMER
jgi:hypothetical protein